MSKLGVVVFGASTYEFHPELFNERFANSAREVASILADPTIVADREVEVLNLFDQPLNPGEVEIRIHDFVAQDKHDYVVYYCGHGDVGRREGDYRIFLRSSRRDRRNGSLLDIVGLIRDLQVNAAQKRVYFVLDCCFSGTAVAELQETMDAGCTEALIDRSLTEATQSGTAVLSSSGSRGVALAKKDDRLSLFTGALVRCLKEGVYHKSHSPMLSWLDVKDEIVRMTRDRLGPDAPVPKLTNLSDDPGDLTRLAFFVNRAYVAQASVGGGWLSSPDQKASEHLYWKSISNSDDCPAVLLEDFLAKFPDGTFAPLARLLLERQIDRMSAPALEQHLRDYQASVARGRIVTRLMVLNCEDSKQSAIGRATPPGFAETPAAQAPPPIAAETKQGSGAPPPESEPSAVKTADDSAKQPPAQVQEDPGSDGARRGRWPGRMLVPSAIAFSGALLAAAWIVFGNRTPQPPDPPILPAANALPSKQPTQVASQPATPLPQPEAPTSQRDSAELTSQIELTQLTLGGYDEALLTHCIRSCRSDAAKAEAERRISVIGREKTSYQAARGDPARLQAYLRTCVVCKFKTETSSELAQLARRNSFMAIANRDMDGGDIIEAGSLLMLRDTSQGECEARCRARRDCVAVSFDRWNNSCYLKDTVIPLTLDPHSVTMIRADQQTPGSVPATERFCAYNNSLLTGEGQPAFSVPSPRACEISCGSDRACVAYSFMKVAKLCLKFSTTSNREKGVDAVSAVKTQRSCN
ncbi:MULTISPECIES: PAN domain-containing protein [Rhodopseudomonas]|uniref:Apple domain-containing protein n=1 Tax=Rhodopseudomonas palustris TaxID=1076 RepID=A0A0D7EX63_RHOPL|nr:MULTISPECIES: PAN domain-containing protein [Rhodopseudomonas]KIZ44037.1 hypothetical protein OO17_10325 [Rhodopseudomonas palustris]MDF3809313.1 PAN domain-containing protein [Rhodopseudomonas sp. BAL398]WOK19006.1 PAN domain-containing protein [Rhodopseudomonas sp. BAL398]